MIGQMMSSKALTAQTWPRGPVHLYLTHDELQKSFVHVRFQSAGTSLSVVFKPSLSKNASFPSSCTSWVKLS